MARHASPTSGLGKVWMSALRFAPSRTPMVSGHRRVARSNFRSDVDDLDTCKRSSPLLRRKRTSGHVLQITTSLVDHAISGVPSVLASLTKGGLNAATKSLAIEYAKTGIRANAVSPGAIKSPMHASETHEALGALHPVGHMGEMSDIVNAVLYLDSAPFVTGEILHVDGGQSAGH
jgi:NAD(P)-dependent dehydrogenase (short-subunit alcohol dehydrogenase family)